WVNSKGFKTSYNLYGLWIAKHYIEKTNRVYLVEGQGDVWRMNEAGIKNTLGIFGADLSEYQLSLLEKMPILDVVVLTDMDDAGRKAANRIVNKCGRRFNYSIPELPTKDVGEMTIEQIEERFSL
ncbi:MAG: toprim domain-containing protein, partial [Smithella sp.]